MNSDMIIQDHATFRVLLHAMSRPGSISRLPHLPGVSGQCAQLTGIVRCLMDNEVTCHIQDDPQGELAREISRVTGSVAVERSAADFLVFPHGTSRGTLSVARRGTLEYPDSGATVIYLVDKLEETGGGTALQGPGINGKVRPLISGLATDELGLLRTANAEFPLGLDALFLDRDGSIMCIPRSTRIGVN